MILTMSLHISAIFTVFLGKFTRIDVSIFIIVALFLPLFILLTIPTYKIFYWSKSKKRIFCLFAYPSLLILPMVLFGIYAVLTGQNEKNLGVYIPVFWTFYIIFTNLLVIIFLPKKITQKRGNIYLWIGIAGWIIIIVMYFVM